jgi:hypothetical protein
VKHRHHDGEYHYKRTEPAGEFVGRALFDLDKFFGLFQGFVADDYGLCFWSAQCFIFSAVVVDTKNPASLRERGLSRLE